jgi:hypothetical protein
MVWFMGHSCNPTVLFLTQFHGDNWLEMLGDEMVPELVLIGEQPKWFMQDGAPPHYATTVRHWLDDMFPHRWIGRRGPVEWAPGSPDLNPLDFAFWGIPEGTGVCC